MDTDIEIHTGLVLDGTEFERNAERQWKDGVESRLQALEQRDAFLERVDKLSLKKGDFIIVKTHIQLEINQLVNGISNHVGFHVPVIILDPGDSITVVKPDHG